MKCYNQEDTIAQQRVAQLENNGKCDIDFNL
jgi:hypothetical protein